MTILQRAQLAILSVLSLSELANSHCTSPPPPPACKTYPGSSDWPSNHAWSKFNETLGGKLIRPVPPGAVCHPDQTDYDDARCSNVAKAWKTYDFHASNPVSVMTDQFANFTCLPDKATPCSPAGYPAYVVNATSAEDVKNAVDFARTHKVLINVKSTGHDYIGRSNAPGTLSIWTRYLNGMLYHAGQFRLEGSGRIIAGNAATVGAGTHVGDIYNFTDVYNQTIVGGGAKTVSVGGYVTGGGHSILAPRYGLAADNVLQIQVVTPDGRIRDVNEDRDGDLFWALRGGGGSTFGVITSMTLKTHASPRITAVEFAMDAHASDPQLREYIGYVSSQATHLMNAGLSGYTFLSNSMPSFASGTATSGSNDTIAAIAGSLILQDQTAQDALRILRPLNETLHQRWKGRANIRVATTEYTSFAAWFNTHHDQGTAGGSFWLVSRLIPEDKLTGSEQELGEALWSALQSIGSVQFFLVGGKGVQAAKPGVNAVNPAWRKAYVHALAARGFQPFNETASREAVKTLDESFEALRALTPDSGAYINEALPFERNWQETFWGANYERLLQIKRHIDPEDVLWCAPCVGIDCQRSVFRENDVVCIVHETNYELTKIVKSHHGIFNHLLARVTANIKPCKIQSARIRSSFRHRSKDAAGSGAYRLHYRRITIRNSDLSFRAASPLCIGTMTPWAMV
ncbi:hypothetical protein QQS21_000449 [Conoideocrella luteorostrata]|uniref:FAD-binding PCMH-type domain-containing protein n=1 Tax=Conoideocrella luteorostrata TaxID=1105319 RepID=A0AAJ0G2S0_9HYPO|nr:hypothetical protein QQS21_000449 [Conoideocrella luteorostrata]